MSRNPDIRTLTAGEIAAVLDEEEGEIEVHGNPGRPMPAALWRLPTLSFIGHSGCGKDEAGNWLAARTPLRFAHTTSWYLAPYVAAETGLPLEVLRGPGRHAHKEEMFRVGRRLRESDPGVLVRLARADGNDIVSGVRDPEEVDYMREHDVVDLVVWIDRDVPDDPTMRRFGPTPWAHADVRVDNTGTLAGFHARLRRLARALGVPVTD